MSNETRYLLMFAHLPGEAAWCVSSTFEGVAVKARALWEVTDCALVYYVTSASGGKAAAVRITCEDEFQMWHRGGETFTSKLVVHDRARAVRVHHSTGFSEISQRPLLDPMQVSEARAKFYLRHSATDEVVLARDDEMAVWGSAVQKAQRAWNVHRPLLRYPDDLHGERVVVSIVDAKDFAMWDRHRRPLQPELVVYEHAAVQLLDNPAVYAASPPEGCGVAGVTTARSATSAADETASSSPPQNANLDEDASKKVVRVHYVNPPSIQASMSVQQLHEPATGRELTAQVPLTPGEQEVRQLKKLLERRTEISELAKKQSHTTVA